MFTVTYRVQNVKQPKGGYIHLSDFDTEIFIDDNELSDEENVHASVVGMVVDYMTRYMMGANIEVAFQTSIIGAERAEKFGNKGSKKAVNNYLNNIDGLDDVSIKNACRAVTYDVWLRNVFNAFNAKKDVDTNPDSATVHNIQVMVNRSIDFLKSHSPIIADGFTFEGGGHTKIVSSGDGDYITNDTLWDFKVSKNKPKSTHTLQILVYYIMGKHSGKIEFQKVKKIGIFNPRQNVAYTMNISNIPVEIIHDVEKNVIGYDM